MERFYKHLELATNLIVILLALLLGSIAINRFVLTKEPAPRPPAASMLGKKIELAEVDWSRTDRHLVLVLQKGCHFCSESAPFYQNLIKAFGQRPDIDLVAALPQPVNESKEYLSGLGVSIPQIRQADPMSLGATGTPTLLLVDRSGIVKEVWVGKLSPAKEQEVLNKLAATL